MGTTEVKNEEGASGAPGAGGMKPGFIVRLEKQGKAGLIQTVLGQVEKTIKTARSPATQNLLDSVREVSDLFAENGATTVSAAEVTKLLRAAEVAFHKTPNYIGTLLGEGGLFLPVVWIDGRKRYVVSKDEKVRQQLIADFGRMPGVSE